VLVLVLACVIHAGKTFLAPAPGSDQNGKNRENDENKTPTMPAKRL
jgi:hypothetical protein